MNTAELKKLADDLTWVKHTADWSTCDKAAAELRRLHAENEALRAQIGQGEPVAWQRVPKEPTDEMLRAGAFRTTPGVAYRAMLAVAPPAPQALTTCNCRWDGDTQVQQCTLHQAHIDALHEWAERAKTAEAKLVAQQQKPLTDERIDELLSEWLYVAPGRTYEEHRPFARAIEAAATEPLLQRIAELESENEVLNRLMRSGEQRGVAKGLEEGKERIAELERQLEEALKDAGHYRQLRNSSNWPAVFASHDAPEPLRGEELDVAMQKGQP